MQLIIVLKFVERNLSSLTTLSFACISLSFRLAKTCMCELTCFLVLVFPVLNLIYLAMSSLRPENKISKWKIKLLTNDTKICSYDSIKIMAVSKWRTTSVIYVTISILEIGWLRNNRINFKIKFMNQFIWNSRTEYF